MAFVTTRRRTSRAEVTLSGSTPEGARDEFAEGAALHSSLRQSLDSLMPGLEVLLDGLEEQGALRSPADADFKAGAQEIGDELTLRVSRQPPLSDAELSHVRARLEQRLVSRRSAPARNPWWKFWGR